MWSVHACAAPRRAKADDQCRAANPNKSLKCFVVKMESKKWNQYVAAASLLHTFIVCVCGVCVVL